MHYSIHAVDTHGGKIVVGEGFKGESEANAAIRLISRELGLRQPENRTDSPAANDDEYKFNALAADN